MPHINPYVNTSGWSLIVYTQEGNNWSTTPLPPSGSLPLSSDGNVRNIWDPENNVLKAWGNKYFNSNQNNTAWNLPDRERAGDFDQINVIVINDSQCDLRLGNNRIVHANRITGINLPLGKISFSDGNNGTREFQIQPYPDQVVHISKNMDVKVASRVGASVTSGILTVHNCYNMNMIIKQRPSMGSSGQNLGSLQPNRECTIRARAGYQVYLQSSSGNITSGCVTISSGDNGKVYFRSDGTTSTLGCTNNNGNLGSTNCSSFGGINNLSTINTITGGSNSTQAMACNGNMNNMNGMNGMSNFGATNNMGCNNNMVGMDYNMSNMNNMNNMMNNMGGSTVVDILTQNPSFSTFVMALNASGMLGPNSNALNNVTIFAPTNDAFSKLPPGTLQSLLNNPTALNQLLRAHIVSGSIPSSQLSQRSSVITLEGTTIPVRTQNGTIFVGNAQVIQCAMPSSNGTVYAVDNIVTTPNFSATTTGAGATVTRATRTTTPTGTTTAARRTTVSTNGRTTPRSTTTVSRTTTTPTTVVTRTQPSPPPPQPTESWWSRWWWLVILIIIIIIIIIALIWWWAARERKTVVTSTTQQQPLLGTAPGQTQYTTTVPSGPAVQQTYTHYPVVHYTTAASTAATPSTLTTVSTSTPPSTTGAIPLGVPQQTL